jgi:phosphoribosyl 1,2-cyclic phosphodiesterase
VTFYGVRGSTPCQSPEIGRYGGNTSCVALDIPGHEPVLFDLGTGLRYFGLTFDGDQPARGTCLLSHLHWDHIQGLPFFTPLLRDGSEFHVYAPSQANGDTVTSVMESTIRPPLFPIELDGIPGTLRFHDVESGEFDVGHPADPIRVMARPIPHVGRTMGYRVSWHGTTVVYISDHQQPADGEWTTTDDVLALCDGADLLIHDAQYTPEEFAQKPTWGHCTSEYAVWLADEAGVRTLALFHHDPMHDDWHIDRTVKEAQRLARRADVFAAAERTTYTVGSR